MIYELKLCFGFSDHESLESHEFNHTSLRLYALRMAARAEQVRIRVIREIRGQKNAITYPRMDSLLFALDYTRYVYTVPAATGSTR